MESQRPLVAVIRGSKPRAAVWLDLPGNAGLKVSKKLKQWSCVMFRKNWIQAIVTVAIVAASVQVGKAGTFGTVVPISGEAADIALDPARGLLYIANFTANRIDVMTLSNNVIQTSIN